MQDVSGESDAAAPVGSGCRKRIEISQPIQKPDHTRRPADRRDEAHEQKIPEGARRYRLGKLHVAQHPVAKRISCAGQKDTVEVRPAPNTDFAKQPDMNCAPAPTYLANSTLETYSQGTVPLASSNCMDCHNNAVSYQRRPANAAPDFKFYRSIGLHVHAGKGAVSGPAAAPRDVHENRQPERG